MEIIGIGSGRSNAFTRIDTTALAAGLEQANAENEVLEEISEDEVSEEIEVSDTTLPDTSEETSEAEEASEISEEESNISE